MAAFSDKNRSRRLQQLGSIAETVVHDVNNHLMLALNHLVAGDSGAARRSIETCGGLTNSLLNFTRGPAMMRRVPLDEIILETLSSLTKPAGIELKVGYGHMFPGVLMNPREICRAVTNLLFNGFDAVGESGTVTVEANGRRLWVTDTGCGVAPELHEKIFEPHFTTKGPQGNGLGLSIVRDIMRRHGGSVQVASRMGHGSTFTLQFPSRM